MWIIGWVSKERYKNRKLIQYGWSEWKDGITLIIVLWQHLLKDKTKEADVIQEY